MARQQPQSYLDLYSKEKERILDQHARVRAAIEGPPPGGRKPNDRLESAAWNNADPAVTMEHYAQIAQETVARLMQDTDESGMPRWTLDQIEQAVKYEQTMATYPWRRLTYETGVPDDAYEEKAKAAARAAKRYGQPAQSPAGVWETVEEAEVMPQQQAQPQQQAAQQPMGRGGSY